VTTGRPRAATIALLLILSVHGVQTLWKEARSVAGLDFYQFWVGARMARVVNDFYAPETRQRMGAVYLAEARASGNETHRFAAEARPYLDTLSTPLLYVFAAALPERYETSLRAFQLAMLAALLLAFLVFTRTYRVNALTALALFAVVSLAFRATRTEVLVVNLNFLLLLLVAVSTALLIRNQFLLAGALLALTTLMKPNILPVLPLVLLVLLLQRRMRPLLSTLTGALVAGLAGYALSAWYFASPRIWLDWLHAFRTMPASVTAMESGNFALARIVLDRTGFDPAAIFMLLLFGVTALVAHRFRGNPDLVLAAPALGCLVFLLGSPLMWPQYLLLTIPALFVLLRSSRPPTIAFGLIVLALAMDPWGASPASLGVVRLALICNAAVFALWVITLRALHAPLERRPVEQRASAR
jgi:4-amino-4-deoxy-L-arabinose transferase-like glycosyltransferase